MREANNRGNAEKQKAIRHDLNRLCRVVPAGRTSGRGSGRWVKGDLEEFGVSGTYLPGAGSRPFTLPEGSKGREGAIKGKLKGFHLLPQCRERAGLGFQIFDSCWPRGSAGFVRPFHTLSLQEASTVPGATSPTERSSPSQPRAEPLPSISRRPKRGPPAQAHFCKSLSSRHPLPSTDPAVIGNPGWIRGHTCTPKEDRYFRQTF